ncbi:hypothetical protein [Falsigemmobacter faecalis]|uniref:Uncharacterized protein n=1 Tax=Falsigemmobacter faecalis TaxID=2488730 RepID=A0A3P3DKZ4_9RHOB|nr:hypothetical protein [Falsigemmobacter faecalis]RRH74282.1 hypothetical protein EG244_11050 [Falsigemmobacter faecalis]
MQLISDVFLAAGAFGAALYCFVLQRRLVRFTGLEGDMGSAIAILSGQVDDLTRALAKARKAAEGPTGDLEDLTRRAGAATARLELLMSSLHDLPAPANRRDSPPEPPRGVAPARIRRYRIRPAPGVA